MKFWRQLQTRYRSIARRRLVEDELDDELRFHLEMEIEKNIASGMSPAEAKRAAAIALGGLEQTKEVCRDSWGTRRLSDLFRDLRFGFRRIGKRKGYSTIAIATLMISIGSSAAVFSLIDDILLRSLPVPRPSELYTLYWTGENPGLRSITSEYSERDGSRFSSDSVSYPMFLDLREASEQQASVFGFVNLDNISLLADGVAIAANGQAVSSNFFSVLEVDAHRGRLFDTEDEQSTNATIVLSFDLWRKAFKEDPAAIGRTIHIFGTQFTVLGVLPESFRGIRQGDTRSFYVPLSPGSPFFSRDITNREHWFVQMMARIRPTTRTADLKASLSSAFANTVSIRIEYPEILLEPSAGGLAFDRREYRQSLLTLFGVVCSVLLVACLNLAGLSIACSAAREKEFAVRAALGANRWRLARQTLAETFVICTIGGILGVLFASWSAKGLSRLLAGNLHGLDYSFSIDLRVLAFTFAATVATALLTGLLPALKAASADPVEGFAPRASASPRHLRLGKSLVIAQICVSLVLLVAASLYARSFAKVHSIDSGFDTEDLIMFQLNPASAGYEDAPDRIGYYESLQDALRRVPELESATLMQFPLFADKRSNGGFRLSSDTAATPLDRRTNRLVVGEAFFDTLGIPLLNGRTFASTDDAASRRVVVVNEAFARTHAPDTSPIGLSLAIWAADWTIIGVCADTKYDNVKAGIQPTTYFPLAQLVSDRNGAMRSATFAVRSRLPLERVEGAIRDTISRIDSRVPLYGLTTLSELRQRNISNENLLAFLCGILGGTSLLLASIGLYGLASYNTKLRASETAIRLAVGALPSAVFNSTLRQSLALAAMGVAVGIPAAILTTPLIQSQLYHTEPNHALTLPVVASILIATVVIATWLPARRASRQNPLPNLRNE